LQCDLDFDFEPRSVAAEPALRFCSGDLSGTLRERFARRLPKPARLLGTVRGSFRQIEAETSPPQTQR
jgi:hypothetical protein